MLAQWKSDRLITCKSLDRNEDMLDFFLNEPLNTGWMNDIMFVAFSPLYSVFLGLTHHRLGKRFFKSYSPKNTTHCDESL
jgi:hypothetical protein